MERERHNEGIKSGIQIVLNAGVFGCFMEGNTSLLTKCKIASSCADMCFETQRVRSNK